MAALNDDDGRVGADEALDRLMEGNAQWSQQQQLACAVEANVRWAMRQILAVPEGIARNAEGHFKLAGAVCEIATGRVRLLA